MRFEVLKGTQDSEPKDQIRINAILDIIRANFESYGFRPLDTPIVEYFETLTLKYDKNAEIVEEIFKLSDRGKRKLGLRYDLTTPLSRYVAANNKKLKKPFRRYQIGKVFRDGPIKTGRAREFIQCDGDVIGTSGVEIEAELLTMFYNTYKELGITPILEINNNKILRGALLQEGFKQKDLSSIILSIDKLKKIGEKGVLDEIKEKGFDIKKAKAAIETLSAKDFKAIEKLTNDDLLKEGIEELKKLTAMLKEFKVEFRINFSMSRGLDIYTGNIWESYDKKEKITSSLGSGGRYDKVIGEYASSNEEIPAVGVSFGLVPIMACLKDGSEKEGLTQILVVPLEAEFAIQAQTLAQTLRKDFRTEVYYGYKLKKAFDYAQYLGCDNIAILGKKDIEEGKYTLKNIVSGKEGKIKL